jgi:hypothetical protein
MCYPEFGNVGDGVGATRMHNERDAIQHAKNSPFTFNRILLEQRVNAKLPNVIE